MKVSDWFPSDVKPVRKGWYFVSIGITQFEGWAYWHGERWGGINRQKVCPAFEPSPRSDISFLQSKRWKGMLK